MSKIPHPTLRVQIIHQQHRPLLKKDRHIGYAGKFNGILHPLLSAAPIHAMRKVERPALVMDDRLNRFRYRWLIIGSSVTYRTKNTDIKPLLCRCNRKKRKEADKDNKN